MQHKIIVFFAVAFFIFSLSGCATFNKKADLEMQGLRNQISVLETQITAKDTEITSLREDLSKCLEQKNTAAQALEKKAPAQEIKSRPKMIQIQTALKNSGVYFGSIDGKTGKETRGAIKAFQRQHGLAADGKVGRQTWALLKEYLNNKIK